MVRDEYTVCTERNIKIYVEKYIALHQNTQHCLQLEHWKLKYLKNISVPDKLFISNILMLRAQCWELRRQGIMLGAPIAGLAFLGLRLTERYRRNKTLMCFVKNSAFDTVSELLKKERSSLYKDV